MLKCFTRMETTYGGKGKQTEDGEADEDQRNEAVEKTSWGL